MAPVITLQAVSFALRQLDDLPEDERALGLDRAEILIRRESGTLNSAWRGEPMPELLLDLVADAASALRAATLGSAVELLVLDALHGGPFAPDECRAMPECAAALSAIDRGALSGEIHLALPGTLLAPGEIMGFLIGCTPRAWRRKRLNAAEAFREALPVLAEALAPVKTRYVESPRQVYRQMDAMGRIIGDVATLLVNDPLAGQPLLVRVWSDGVVSRPVVDAGERTAQQRRAWPAGGLTVTASD